MSGTGWHVFTFGTLLIFLIVIAYRTLKIIRLPVHLRWELAPIPHEKGKGHYGGSYLEEYEWWNKPLKHSHLAPVIYMAKEILLLRGVWRHNRGLWPFSYSLHLGIYLVILMLILQVINAVLIITGVPLSVVSVLQDIVSVLAAAGYILGAFGAISLVIKRSLDTGYRAFSTVSTYFNLVFLGALFISGGYAWLASSSFVPEMNVFINQLLTLDSVAGISVALSIHVIILLLFILYLPFTGMIHFIAKYFTYHGIRWNDEPLNPKLEVQVRKLMNQPVAWSAAHVKTGRITNWADLTEEKTDDE